jgi:CMP-N-acetylneuraminic acid synthetase
MAQKKIEDIVLIVQARVNSTRIPNKMLRNFDEENLFEIAINKIIKSKVLPKENFYVSLHDDALKKIAKKYDLNIYHRSKESVSESKDTRIVSEWYNKLNFKYYIIVNACCPLLTIETIDKFIKYFLNSKNDSLFAVHEKRNFYWDTAGVLKTEYPGTMDTKLVEMVYEAAHCLYAGKMSRIGEGIYLGNFTKNDPELFTVEEKETFDIDYEWQFRVAEVLYKNREYVLNEQ